MTAPRPDPAPARTSRASASRHLRLGAAPALSTMLALLVCASPAAAQAPQITLPQPAPGKIRVQGTQPPTVTLTPGGPQAPILGSAPGAAPTPQIESRLPQAPRLPGPKMTQGRFDDPALRNDVARLRRQANPASGYGSTTAAAEAAWVLGLIELHGGVAASSPQVAQTWFERAVRLNKLPIAWAGVAWCHINGCSDWPDSSRAEQAIAKLRPHYPARALYLEWVLKSRSTPLTVGATEAPGITSVTLPARSLLEQAAAAGDAQARVELGINAVTSGDLSAALRYFKAAASHSRAAAANIKLIESLQQQQAAEKSAGDASEADQLFAQAQRLHRGLGGPTNYLEAMRLYRKAAEAGSAPAKRMLAAILSRPLPDGSVNVAWMAQLAYLDTTGQLPALDARAMASVMYRDPTPLFDLMPARWQRALSTIPEN